ncbi:hypothetical protein E2C01_059426 [Portunus trituberculatus]|uniref:Uncharacterized protein n=1 Tax=Portunus trituberculatus TaxID=210409 RepID=A0A5B7H5B8_PORTR|nr:hypothetical protein [Portunus trituberculatus]
MYPLQPIRGGRRGEEGAMGTRAGRQQEVIVAPEAEPQPHTCLIRPAYLRGHPLMGVRGRAVVIHTRYTKDSVYIQTEGVSCRDEAAPVTCSYDMTYG